VCMCVQPRLPPIIESRVLSRLTPTMPGLLSLPSEMLCAIVETVSRARQPQLAILTRFVYQSAQPERCCLRATCKVLNEHTVPFVFRRLGLYFDSNVPNITEHQILALATRSSKACEFTRDLEINLIPNGLCASEQSWPHFGHCDDLRVHLPTAISMLQNLTRFR
jgi:hypothetical protein